MVEIRGETLVKLCNGGAGWAGVAVWGRGVEGRRKLGPVEREQIRTGSQDLLGDREDAVSPQYELNMIGAKGNG